MSTAQQVLTGPMIQSGTSRVSLTVIQERARKKKWKNSFRAWLLLLPSLIFLGIFTVYPIIQSLISSFYKDDLSTVQPVFTGLENYQALLTDPVFWECMKNNLLIAVVTVPASILLGVAMASFSNSLGKWGKTVTRIGFIYPTFIPLVAAANIWMFIYTLSMGFWDISTKTGASWQMERRPFGLSWSCWSISLPTLENFKRVMAAAPFGQYYINTIIIAAGVLAVSLW